MRRSDAGEGAGPRPTAVDWRGWVALAWVLWFGLLYGKMIVERRGDRLRALVPVGRGAAGAPGPSLGIVPDDAPRRGLVTPGADR